MRNLMNFGRGLVTFLLVLALGAGAAQAQVNAYVASTGNTSVLTIDTATNTVTASVAGTGSRVLALSPDGNFIYSTNFNSVSKIDTATNTIVATVPTGNLTNGLVLTQDGATLYVLVNGAADSYAVDTATMTVVSTIPSLGPSAIAMTPDGASVWLSDGFGVVSVIDTATNTVSTTFPLGTAPSSIAFSADGALAYLANFGANTFTVFDTATHVVVATVPVGNRPFYVALTPDGAFAYVANLLGNSVSIVDTATLTVVSTVPVGAFPRAIAFTLDGASAYVTNFNDNNISVIDTATQTVATTFPAGSRPWGIVIGRAPNVSPVLASDQASITVNEGQAAANTGTVSDGNGDTVTLTASKGSVINHGDGTWSWSFLTSDGPTQSQTVTITGDDGQSGTSTTTFALVVDNVAPTITSVSNNGPVTAGSAAIITVAATDPAGANDPLSYAFDCDNNGTFEIGPQAGNGTACAFGTAGSRTVNVRVTDGDGGVATGSTVVTVLVPDTDGDGFRDNVDNCPLIANPSQANFDFDSLGDACDADVDGDGRANAHDVCPFTPPGTVVGRLTGCSIAQLCPCSGPIGTSHPWYNHGQYVACVTVTAVAFRLENLITTPQKVQIIKAAAQSSCGR